MASNSKKQPETIYLKMTHQQARYFVDTEPDFVNNKRYGYSLKKLKEAHEGACSPRLAAQALASSEDEIEQEYQDILVILKNGMGVDSL